VIETSGETVGRLPSHATYRLSNNNADRS